MALRRRTILIIAVVALAAVVATTLATTLPRLNDAKDDAARHWRTLRAPLAERYDRAERLAGAVAAQREDLDLAGETKAAVDRWSRSAGDLQRGPTSANTVEGHAARLVGVVKASAVLSSDPQVSEALDAFAAALPEDEIRAYNRAVEEHDRARTRFPGRWLSSLLGAESLTTVDIPSSLLDLSADSD